MWICEGVPGCTQKYMELSCVCVWDESLEYLLETRVLTSADFNTYPIRIFYIVPCDNFGIFRLELIPLKIAIYQIYDIS